MIANELKKKTYNHLKFKLNLFLVKKAIEKFRLFISNQQYISWNKVFTTTIIGSVSKTMIQKEKDDMDPQPYII